MRVLLRLAGFVVVAMAFLLVMLDGTRSIGGGTLVYTSVSEVWRMAHPRSLQMLQPLIEQAKIPYLWDPATLWVLLAPAALVLLVLGLLLVRLGRAREEVSIGYSARP